MRDGQDAAKPQETQDAATAKAEQPEGRPIPPAKQPLRRRKKVRAAAQGCGSLRRRYNSQNCLLRYRAISEIATDFGFACRVTEDGEMEVEWVSESFTRITGYTLAHLKEGGWVSIIHPEDLALVSETLAATLQSAPPSSYEFRVVTIDGRVRWLRCFTRASGNRHTGRVTRLYGGIQDITEQKEAEAALATRELRFRLVTESIREIVTLLDENGVIAYESPALTPILGYAPEEMIGRNAFEFIHPGDLKAVLGRIAEGLGKSEEPTAPLEYRFRHKDGSYRWLESIGTNALATPGLNCLLITSRDVTERRRMQAQAMHREKLAAVGELVAGVAHEINNPLAAISGTAQLLEMHPDAQVKEDAATIRQMADRANHIVRALRAFARHGGEEADKRPADMNKVVEAALDMMRYKLRMADVDVTRHLTPDLPPALIDSSQIEQALVNLISNAEHALRVRPVGQRRIEVHTGVRTEAGEGPDRPVWITAAVMDNGAGFPESLRSRIFEPFYTTKETGEGTGLGLSICHSIIEAHGGTITVDSIEGQGSVFRISLPAAVHE